MMLFDAVRKSWSLRSKRSPKNKGVFVTVRESLASEETEDLIFLKDLIEAGKIKSAIDRRYPLERIPEAHSYVEKGHEKGNVVITVEHSNKS